MIRKIDEIEKHLSSELLPAAITEHDLEYPKFNKKKLDDYFAKNLSYEEKQFELWLVPGFGWCIPTLGIRNARREGQAPRTYAIQVNTRKLCRIGLGPHVTKRVTVYVRENRVEALRQFIDLKNKGAADANLVRDRISTRRAQTAMYRSLVGW